MTFEIESNPSDSHLYVEQATGFTLVLTNTGSAPETVLSLDGNTGTPTYLVFNEKGTEIGRYDLDSRRARRHSEQEYPLDPVFIKLPPGQKRRKTINLGQYAEPLPAGRYFFEACHVLLPNGTELATKRIPFEVVKAEIGSAALGYESPERMVSTMAWLARDQHGNGNSRLLLRGSGTNHGLPQRGAYPAAEAPGSGKVSVSQIPLDGAYNEMGWTAMSWGSKVEVIHHDMALPVASIGPVDLETADLMPIPRFPDRGSHCVFLATGKGSQGSELVGMLVAQPEEDDEDEPPKPKPLPKVWRVPLSAPPFLTATVFGQSGLISLALASHDGAETAISRLDVSETGNASGNARVVYRTRNQVLALIQDMRPGNSLGFWVIESDPTEHNRIGATRIGLVGDPRVGDLMKVAGWPVGMPSLGGASRALPAREFTAEIALDGELWIALTDADGTFYGGKLNPSAVKLLRRGDPAIGLRCVHPHIASLALGATTSCFTETGQLFHTGYRGSH